MAAEYDHVQIGVIDSSGNVNIIYPQTYAKDVIVEQGENTYLINSGIISAQGLAETAGDDLSLLKSKNKAIEEIVMGRNIGSHNSLFRGKDLTSIGIDEICNRITSGTFDDLYIGDYFVSSIVSPSGESESVINVLTEFDTLYNTGDTSLLRHHAVIVPRYCFNTKAKMNESVNFNGYANSGMKNTILPQYAEAINYALRGHLISYRSYETNAINSNTKSGRYTGNIGAASACGWYDETLELLSETDVFGTLVTSSSAFESGINRTQLAYFSHNPSGIISNKNNTRVDWWLRNFSAYQYCAYVNASGIISMTTPTNVLGVRPKYIIG